MSGDRSDLLGRIAAFLRRYQPLILTVTALALKPDELPPPDRFPRYPEKHCK